MLPDHEMEDIISDALTKAGVEPPAGGEVGRTGSLNDVARAIMDALADAGITLVKK